MRHETEEHTDLIAPLQVLDFVCKLFGLAVALVLQLLHAALDLLVQLLQLLDVVLKLLQQPIRRREETAGLKIPRNTNPID